MVGTGFSRPQSNGLGNPIPTDSNYIKIYIIRFIIKVYIIRFIIYNTL